MTIHIGNAPAGAIKIGSSDAKAVYAGSDQIWPLASDKPKPSFFEMCIYATSDSSAAINSGPMDGADIQEGDTVIVSGAFQGNSPGKQRIWVNDELAPDYWSQSSGIDSIYVASTVFVADSRHVGIKSSFKIEKPPYVSDGMIIAAIIPKSAYKLDDPVVVGWTSGFVPASKALLTHHMGAKSDPPPLSDLIEYSQTHEMTNTYAGGLLVNFTVAFGNVYVNGSGFLDGNWRPDRGMHLITGTANSRRLEINEKLGELKAKAEESPQSGSILEKEE